MRSLTGNSRSVRGIVFWLAVVCVFCSAVNGAPWAGSGVEGDPYLIYDACDMQAIGADSNYWGAHFKLMADINLIDYNESNFNMIGTHPTEFTGIFDGNGRTISNLTLNLSGCYYVGLFSGISGAEIKDLRLIDPNVRGASNVGALVGWGEHRGTIAGCYIEGGIVSGINNVGGLVGRLEYYDYGEITDCRVEGGIVSGNNGVGGLLGVNENGTITNCFATGAVSGYMGVGGLVGWNSGNEGSTITNCIAAGEVSGHQIVGGLAGGNGEYKTITNCIATGAVSGYEEVGGLAGGNTGAISNCYSTGEVFGRSVVGGFIGSNGFTGIISNCYTAGVITITYGDAIGGFVACNDWGDIFDSFWDVNTIGWPYGVGTNVGGIGTVEVYGRTTAEMKQQSTFTDYGWDFVGEAINGSNDVWRMCADGAAYPKLWWEFTAGDFVCPDGVDFADFAVLAMAWMLEDGEEGYNPRCDISEPADERIDMSDLEVFTKNWLKQD